MAMTALGNAAASGALALRPTAAGQPITIRSVRHDDGPVIGDFVRELSPSARYGRFHAGVRELSQQSLDRFTHFDRRCEMALVATVFDGTREIGIGEARYAVSEGGSAEREFAVVVTDAAQGFGVGTRLLQALLHHAERSGIERVYGDLIRDNLPMLGLARKLGFAVRRHPGDARLQRVEKALQVRHPWRM